MFADDTTIFLEDNNIVRLQENVNNELVKINNWLISNRLSINLKKTYYMIFNSSNVLDLNIAGININCVINITFVGVIIDQKLNWKLEIAGDDQLDIILYFSFSVGNPQDSHIGFMLKCGNYTFQSLY